MSFLGVDATRYVTNDGTVTNDGLTIGTAWDLSTALIAIGTWNFGVTNTLLVRLCGDFTISTKQDFDNGASGSGQSCIIQGSSADGTEDAQITITSDTDGFSMFEFGLTVHNTQFNNITLVHNSILDTSNLGWELKTASKVGFRDCTVTNAYNGFHLAWFGDGGDTSECTFTRCLAYNNGNYGFRFSLDRIGTCAIQCTAHNNGSSGFYGGSIAWRCMSYDNGGHGFEESGCPCYAHCGAYYNGLSGFYKVRDDPGVYAHCLAVGNNQYGWNIGTGAYAMLDHCADYANVMGRSVTTGTGLIDDDLNPVTLNGDPFTDRANNDYSYNTTTGAGAALYNTSGILTVDGLTTSYHNIGPWENNAAVDDDGDGGDNGDNGDVDPPVEQEGINKFRIPIISEVRMRALVTRDNIQAPPKYIAIRPKPYSTTAPLFEGAATPQGFEVLFYPIPDQPYVLEYRYNARPTKIDATTNPYPLGAALHAETILASCLAVAELQRTGQRGPHWETFVERLSASIALDQTSDTITAASSWPVVAADGEASGPPGNNYEALSRDVGGYIGHGYASGEWSHNETGEIDAIVQSGIRQFFYPPIVPQLKPQSHEWSFLRQIHQFTVGGTYSTGTVSVANGSRNIKFSDDVTLPSWTAGAEFAAGGGTYTVDTRDTDTDASLLTTYSGTSDDDATYTLTQLNYTMPSDFASIFGDITYAERNDAYHAIRIVSEERIRTMRQVDTYVTGRPRYAALRSFVTNVAGEPQSQRFELIIWPTPDGAYELQFEYSVDPLSLTVRSNTNTLLSSTIFGNPLHSETVLASCLAVAEKRKYDNKHVCWDRFMERLMASISHDMRGPEAEYLGYNQDGSDYQHEDPHGHRFGRYGIYRNATYLGDTYP